MSKFQIFAKSLLKRTKLWATNFVQEDFSRDLTVRILAFLAVVAIAVIWIFSVLSFPPAEYLVPLRYNSFLGVTSLGSWYELYAVPSILVLLFILNAILAHTAYKKDKMISYILLGTNIFLAIVASSVVISLSIMVSR